MTDTQGADHLIAQVVRCAGGRVVGRVRLQKIFYLLDRLGLQSGLDYEYHHYGPYSAALMDALEDAKAFRLIDERIDYRIYDGVPYSVYTELAAPADNRGGGLQRSEATRALARMQAEEATVLELAATIVWLKREERVLNWELELLRRKAGKATPERIERARKLLCDLCLET